MQTHTHASSGIQTQNPSVQAVKDSTHFRLCGHCDRHRRCTSYQKKKNETVWFQYTEWLYIQSALKCADKLWECVLLTLRIRNDRTNIVWKCFPFELQPFKFAHQRKSLKQPPCATTEASQHCLMDWWTFQKIPQVSWIVWQPSTMKPWKTCTLATGVS